MISGQCPLETDQSNCLVFFPLQTMHSTNNANNLRIEFLFSFDVDSAMSLSLCTMEGSVPTEIFLTDMFQTQRTPAPVPRSVSHCIAMYLT